MNARRPVALFTVFLAFLLLLSGIAAGSATDSLTPADRSSPRDTLTSFITHMNTGHHYLQQAMMISRSAPGFFVHPPEAVEKGDLARYHFERAMQCLDLSEVPLVLRDDAAREGALLLKEILDRIGLPHLGAIPGGEDRNKESERKISRWTIPRTELQLSRVESGEEEGKWLLSPSSLARLEGDYRRIEHLPYLPGATEGAYHDYIVTPGRFFPPKWTEILPEWSGAEIQDQTIWQWISLALALLVFIGLNIGIWRLFRKISRNMSLFAGNIFRILPPVALSLTSTQTILLVDNSINISGSLCILLIQFFSAVRWFGWAWCTVRVGEVIAELIILSPRVEPESIDASLVRTVSRLICITAASWILLYGLSQLGLSVFHLLTGLGVVGLAISLAAKPTVENIIGGLTLFADRSVKVGEYCRFGNTAGTVLHIGLRSTKIEALDQTVISIPNAEFSQMQIVNVSRRNGSLMEQTIRLRHETTRDQLRWILAAVRDVFHAHPMVAAEPVPFARLESFGPSSLDILVFAYIRTKKWAEFLAVQEDLLFRIGEIVEQSGSRFAFPSTTAYIAGDGAIDGEKAAFAAEEVRQWRESGRFPFPDTPEERIAAVLGTVEYPPKS
ncbi:MAG: mechanosensitive ion channel family protein [Aminivibrio sp.]|jgi:MscS family membrane protein|nr:mechanosensitive ion channel family protein [Aminivibrio sp.]